MMEQEKNTWARLLNDKPAPAVVDARLAEAYQRLPARKNNRWKIALRRGLVGAAACLALLCAGDLAAPAFAESLPLVGGIFAYLNDKLGIDRPQYVNETVEEIARQPENVAASAPEGEALPFAISLGEAYCDGTHLGVTLKLTPNDPALLEADYYKVNRDVGEGSILLSTWRVEAGGVQLFGEDAVFRKTDDGGAYVGLMTLDARPLWQNGDFPQTLDVTLELKNLIAGMDFAPAQEDFLAQDRENLITGIWRANFTVAGDLSGTRTYDVHETQNDATLETVQISASETIAIFTVPDGEKTEHWTLAMPQDDQGRKITLHTGQTEQTAGMQRWTYHMEAPESGAQGLCFKIVDKNTDEVIAEFTVPIS